MFITLDGIDGSGKSSQIERLCSNLQSMGKQVLRVRDPGGTPVGEQLRSILLESNYDLSRRCEAMLFLASRAQLIEEQIRPALAAGTVVVSDRFLLANVVYQSIGSDLNAEDLWQVGDWACGGLRPDLTLLLDLPAEVAFARIDRTKDRMESRGVDYLEAVRLAFLMQLPRAAHRTAIINADQSMDAIESEIIAHIKRCDGD